MTNKKASSMSDNDNFPTSDIELINESVKISQPSIRDYYRLAGEPLEELEELDAEIKKFYGLDFNICDRPVEEVRYLVSELKKVDEKKKKETLLNLRLFSSNGKPLEKIDYPLDKVNSSVWGKLSSSIPNAIIDMAKQEGRKKSEVLNAVIVCDLSELEKNPNLQYINKRLTPFDKRVYTVVGNMFYQGESKMVTITDIARAIYNGNPNAKQRQEVRDSLLKMRAISVTFSNEEEAKKYNYECFKYHGSFLNIDILEKVEKNGQTVDGAVELIKEPFLFAFAKGRRQMDSISSQAFKSPLSLTEANLVLEDYILTRVLRMRKQKNKQKNRVILFRTLYEKMGASRNKDRFISKTEKYLMHLAECNVIDDFQTDKKNGKFIIIFDKDNPF